MSAKLDIDSRRSICCGTRLQSCEARLEELVRSVGNTNEECNRSSYVHLLANHNKTNRDEVRRNDEDQDPECSHNLMIEVKWTPTLRRSDHSAT